MKSIFFLVVGMAFVAFFGLAFEAILPYFINSNSLIFGPLGMFLSFFTSLFASALSFYYIRVIFGVAIVFIVYKKLLEILFGSQFIENVSHPIKSIKKYNKYVSDKEIKAHKQASLKSKKVYKTVVYVKSPASSRNFAKHNLKINNNDYFADLDKLV